MYSDSQEMAEPAEKKEEEGEYEETTIPKSICPGMKVGDEVVLKITGELEDEWRVAYAPQESKEHEESEPEEGMMAPGGAKGPPTEMGGMYE